MFDPVNSLVLDLVEWVGKEPRHYAEVMDAWRTSCPRLTVWEDALDLGYVARVSGQDGTMVIATPLGRSFLRENGRVLAPAFDNGIIEQTSPLPVS